MKILEFFFLSLTLAIAFNCSLWPRLIRECAECNRSIIFCSLWFCDILLCKAKCCVWFRVHEAHKCVECAHSQLMLCVIIFFFSFHSTVNLCF